VSKLNASNAVINTAFGVKWEFVPCVGVNIIDKEKNIKSNEYEKD